MQSKMEMVRAKVAECVRIAEAKYGITMPKVDIRFDIRGARVAGYAGRKGMVETGTYYLRFNPSHMALGGATWDHLLNDTVPHEVAHTVCQRFPQFGRNHDGGWKSVCRALGGNGKTKYTVGDAPEAHAMIRPFTYTTDRGQEVRVTPRIHAKIQRGASYTYRGLGVVNRNSPVTKTQIKEIKKMTETVTKTKKAPVAKAGKETNTSKMRAVIASGKTFDECVTFGVETLGQKKTLAISYVKTQWAKAGRTDAMV